MRGLWLIIVGWMVCAPGVAAQSATAERPLLLRTEASEALLEEGRRAYFDFRLPEATRTFRRLMRRPDGEAAGRYYLAETLFLQAIFSEEQTYYDQFYAQADSLLDHLDDVPESTWRRYLEAEAHLLRAVAAARSDNFFRAALAGRGAYNRFEDLIEDQPDFYDAYLGMGLMHLLIGSLPSEYRWLLGVIGFGGTVEEGLNELRQAAARSRLSREEAGLYVALTDLLLHHSAGDGIARLERLSRQYPQSALVDFVLGYGLLINRRVREAEQRFRKVVQAGASAPYFYLDYADYYLAQSLFMQDQFAEAERYYRRYLNRHRGLALRAVGLYELGLAIEMQGRRAEAVPFYAQVRRERDYDSDIMAYRHAQRLQKTPLTQHERRLFLARNAFDIGDYDRAEGILQEVFDAATDAPTARAHAAYRLGRVYHVQSRLDEAQAAYRFAVENPPTDRQSRWAPWSQLYLAEIHVTRNETRAARTAFEAALDYKRPYDYSQTLEQQAKAALERLK